VSNVVSTDINPGGSGGTSGVTSSARPPWQDACPKVGACGGGAGPSKPDPVNIATGDESNEPAPDIVVYNPAGPAAVFQRTWRANHVRKGYGSPGMPVGWIHNYDYVIVSPQTLTSWGQSFSLVSPNGAAETITPQVDGSGLPTGTFSTSNGAPYKVDGVPNTTTGKWVSITLTWNDRTKWEFTPHNGSNYALTKIYSPTGQSITLVYNGFTRCLTQVKRTDTGAVLMTLAYSATLSSITDIYSRKVVYTTTTGSYGDTVLQKVSQVGPTSGTPPDRWTYTYEWINLLPVPPLAEDRHDPPIVRHEPFLKTVTVPNPTGSGTATATINYDTSVQTVVKVASLVDANGNKTEFTYNALSTVVTIKDAGGNVVHSYTAKFDSDRRNTGFTDAQGNSSTVEYNDSANPYRPTRVTDPRNRVTEYAYDAYGNVLTVTSPRGTVTTYTYDYSAFSLGRLISIQEGSKPATTITYYEPSGLVQSVTGPPPVGSGVVTITHTFTYDTLGNVLTAVGPGNNAAMTITATFNYTTDGGYTQAAALGQPLVITDNLGHTRRFRYDTQGRVTNAWDALNNETRFTYNLAGQSLTVSLPPTGQTGVGRGYVERAYLYVGGPVTANKVYNETGTLVRTTTYTYGPEGELLGATGATEPFSKVYDAAYRLVTLTDGNSQATTYTYDTAGRVATVTYPGGDLLQFPEYFADGQLKKRIDGNGVITELEYNDAEGQLTAVLYPATPGRNLAFTYDATYGRLTGRTDITGTQTYAYGDLDEITSVTTTYTSLPAQTLSYAYFPDGSRSSMTTPVGTFAYTYDGKGRAATVANPYSETTTWTYLNNNWLSTQAMANGHTAVYTYNALGQLTDLLNRLGVGTTLSQFNGMVHDGAGNRLSVTANIPAASVLSGTVSYGYDTKDQVTSEARSGGSAFSTTFGYDGAGNPTTFKGFTRTYNVKNQLTGGTGLGTFAYDGNGNPTTYNSTTATYDPENHLLSFGTALSAEYTAEGLRAWKQNGIGTRTYFLYDGLTPIIELDSSGTATAVNTFGTNGLISRRDVTAGASVFYTFDERGSTTQRLDGTGTVLSSRVSDAFGSLLGIPPTTGDPYDGFGAQWGYYTDIETGLVLCTWRYYDPQLGRWLTRDPIGYGGGVNLYGYVRNNPANFIDADGLNPISLRSQVAAALAGGQYEYAIWLIATAFQSNGSRYVGPAINALLKSPNLQRLLNSPSFQQPIQSSLRQMEYNFQQYAPGAGNRNGAIICRYIADKIAFQLKALNVPGVRVYEIKPTAGRMFIDMKDVASNTWRQWDYHAFVRVGDYVLDWYTGGRAMPYTQWVQQFVKNPNAVKFVELTPTYVKQGL
jgi:RHS repeat-associated protein